MMDAATKILKDHRHPLVHSLKKQVERAAEPATVRQDPCMRDGLRRALRRMMLDLLDDRATNSSDVFDEISTFMPWKRYGEQVRRGVDVYGMVFVHVETNFDNRPVLLFLGTMLGKTLVFHLPDDGGRSPWDNFRRAYPQLAATLDHGQLVKVTSTYRATSSLFGSEDVKYEQEIVDVAWLLDDIGIDDFPEIGGRTMDERERTRNSAMIWAVFGRHGGPVSEDQWEQARSKRDPFPEQREESRLLAWKGSGWGSPLIKAQRVYAQQLCRAGGIVAVNFVVKTATGDRLRGGVSATAKHVVDTFPSRFHSQRDITPDPPTPQRVVKVVRFAEDVKEGPSTAATTPHDGDDEATEDVVDTDPGSPFEEQEDRGDGEVSGETSSMAEGTTHSEDDEDSTTSGSWRSQSLGAKAHHRREGWGAFEQRLPKRAQRRRGQRSIPYPDGFDVRVEAQRRGAINRARAEYKASNPERFNEAFLGSDCCNLCGETPKHSNEAECAVHYYLMRGKLPQQCTVPCLYCESPRHTTDACEFLHARCNKCGFRGHMRFECESRTTEEWLIAYLDCVHLGKLTRENLHGPLGGRWGFGPITQAEITEDVWELVKFKELSMVKFRKRTQRGQPGFNPLKEAQLNWNLLLQRRQRISQREKELEDEWAAVEEEKARLRAERSQQRQTERSRPLVHSMGCQTEEAKHPERDGSPLKRVRL